VAFEAQRDRLRTVAYRVPGSHADAEDVVQDAWLRLVRQDTSTIDNLAGWLTTVVGRMSLDLLRSRQARAETSYGQELSEFVVIPDDDPTPDEHAALADSVGRALLVVLDSLTPRSGWRSSCTTCSRSRSTKSARSWANPPTPPK
jgi:RNA polymerase sigma-70 factor (ECF subfamily)